MPAASYSESGMRLTSLDSTTSSTVGYNLRSEAHCSGVRGTRWSGGIFPSLTTPIFMIQM